MKESLELCLCGVLLGSLAGVGFLLGQLPVQTGESWSRVNVGVSESCEGGGEGGESVPLSVVTRCHLRSQTPQNAGSMPYHCFAISSLL